MAKKTKNKVEKATINKQPQAPVETKELAVVEFQPSTVDRSPLNFEWIEFENQLITKKLIETVREHSEIIHTLLIRKQRVDIQIANEMAILRNQFLAYAAKNNLEKTDADGAFYEYAETVFNLKKTRVDEYIRVAQKKALQDLKLPISSLCELARLNDEALEEFLKGWPEEEIATMTFREVQVLVRDNNENKVIRQTTKSSGGGGSGGGWTKTPTSTTAPSSIQPSLSTQGAAPVDIEDTAEVITGEVEPAQETVEPTEPNEHELLIAAANLRVAFSELKTAVEKLGLDKHTSDLLAEIAQYYESASKKGDVQ